jgi:MATE family multidrug resistance protein
MSDVRVPAVIAVVAYWCVALPVGWALAFRTSLGAVGMWIGLAAGLGAAALGLAFRFHQQTANPRVRRTQQPLLVETFPEHGTLP